MSSRELPILDKNGEFRTLAGWRSFCTMVYPNDPLSAKFTYQMVVESLDAAENERPEALLLGDQLPRAVDVQLGEVFRVSERARIAGVVFSELYWMVSNHEKPSLRKAIAFTSELLKSVSRLNRNGNRKRGAFSSDERSVKRVFSEFRDVAHLWAAFNILMLETSQETWVDTLWRLVTTESEFFRFLALSQMLDNRVIASNLKVDREPWMVPKTLDLPSTPALKFPGSTLRNAYYSKYRPLEYRSGG